MLWYSSIYGPVNLTHRSERASFRRPFLCLMLYIVMLLMEIKMKQIVALLIVTGFLAGCGAQVSLTASVPAGKDLDVTIKTSETPGN